MVVAWQRYLLAWPTMLGYVLAGHPLHPDPALHGRRPGSRSSSSRTGSSSRLVLGVLDARAARRSRDALAADRVEAPDRLRCSLASSSRWRPTSAASTRRDHRRRAEARLVLPELPAGHVLRRSVIRGAARARRIVMLLVGGGTDRGRLLDRRVEDRLQRLQPSSASSVPALSTRPGGRRSAAPAYARSPRRSTRSRSARRSCCCCRSPSTCTGATGSSPGWAAPRVLTLGALATGSRTAATDAARRAARASSGSSARRRSGCCRCCCRSSSSARSSCRARSARSRAILFPSRA